MKTEKLFLNKNMDQGDHYSITLGTNLCGFPDETDINDPDNYMALTGISSGKLGEERIRILASAYELLDACNEAVSTIEMLMGDKLNPSASMSLASIIKAIKKATL